MKRASSWRFLTAQSLNGMRRKMAKMTRSVEFEKGIGLLAAN